MSLTLRDRALIAAIHDADTDDERVRLLCEYWHDVRRADRSPRAVAYLHLGMLTGIVQRLLREKTRAVMTTSSN